MQHVLNETSISTTDMLKSNDFNAWIQNFDKVTAQFIFHGNKTYQFHFEIGGRYVECTKNQLKKYSETHCSIGQLKYAEMRKWILKSSKTCTKWLTLTYSFARQCNLNASIRLLFNRAVRSGVKCSSTISFMLWNISSKCIQSAAKNVPKQWKMAQIKKVVDKNTIPARVWNSKILQYPSNVVLSNGVLILKDKQLNQNKVKPRIILMFTLVSPGWINFRPQRVHPGRDRIRHRLPRNSELKLRPAQLRPAQI